MADKNEGTKHVEQTTKATEDVRQAATDAATNAPPKRKNRGNLRKRPADDEDINDAEAGGVVQKVQRQREAPLAFTTRRDDKTETFKFESSGVVQQQNDAGATRQLETETQLDRDARALRERASKPTEDATGVLDNTYRGTAAYTDYRAGFRREAVTENGGGGFGPLRASSNVRMTVRVDYQPDICKDYKETGYCGFGDSCKFLHDRGDYKAGWEIDREWEEKQKLQRERMLSGWKPGDDDDEDGEGGGGDSDEDDDGIPFACLICRRTWAEAQDPVVTKCRHYFCEQCALKHNAKSKNCFACEQPTSGIFNVAQDVIRKEKARKRKEAGE